MIHPWHNVTPSGKLPQEFSTFIQILVAILAVVISPAAIAQTDKASDAELRGLMGVYAKAVNEADAKLGSQVWCGSAEDSVTNPAGHWQGPQQITAFYALLRDSYSERKLTFDDVSVHSYGDFAWTEFTGDFSAKQRKDGTPVSFHAAETQIYRRSQGKWCLVHVQYSTFAPQEPSKTSAVLGCNFRYDPASVSRFYREEGWSLPGIHDEDSNVKPNAYGRATCG